MREKRRGGREGGRPRAPDRPPTPPPFHSLSLNKCGVISPRLDVTADAVEQWVVNLLPARQFGHIILTTSYGIMDHNEARRKHTGGKVLGFFY